MLMVLTSTLFTLISTTTRSPADAMLSEENSEAVTRRMKQPRPACPRYAIRHRIVDRRVATWRHQDEIEIPRTRSSFRERVVNGCGYLRWSRHLWATRADDVWRRVVELRDPAEAVCHVFGVYCTEALAVAKCESHLTTTAANGQYLGLFQMGSDERRRYGHGSTALEQTRAAYRYFVASGRDWSPWQCQPSGGLRW